MRGSGSASWSLSTRRGWPPTSAWVRAGTPLHPERVADTYQHVLPTMDHDAARRVAELVFVHFAGIGRSPTMKSRSRRTESPAQRH